MFVEYAVCVQHNLPTLLMTCMGCLSSQIRSNDSGNDTAEYQNDSHGDVGGNVIPFVKYFGVEHCASYSKYLSSCVEQSRRRALWLRISQLSCKQIRGKTCVFIKCQTHDTLNSTYAIFVNGHCIEKSGKIFRLRYSLQWNFVFVQLKLSLRVGLTEGL